MSVNLRRGFYRIWLAVSAVWLICVAAFSYEQVVSPDIQPRIYLLLNANSDFQEYKLRDDPQGLQLPRGFRLSEQREIDFPNNVTLYAQIDIPATVLDARTKRFYEQYSEPREAEARWQSLARASAIGLLPPIALLLSGWAVGWIVSGFRGTSQKS